MASILTPREKSLKRGTTSTPAGTSEKKFEEMSTMSLRSGKRKITISEDNAATPQKENIVKRRKSNKVDILNDSAQNNSVKTMTPKLKDITKAMQNELPKDATPRKTNDKFSTPRQPLSTKKKNTSSSVKKSFHLENDSILLLSPTPQVLAQTAINTPRTDTAKKALEIMKTNENLSSASRRGAKVNTGAIKKRSGLQDDSVIALTPKLEGLTNSAKNKSFRGKKKNAVHPAVFTEIDNRNTESTTQKTAKGDAADNEDESVIIISPDVPKSNNYQQNISNIKAEGVSELLETSSDPEITMNMNSTYELEKSVAPDVKSNLLSTRKSVHFKNSPEILGPIRRSNSSPNISIDSSSENIPKSVKQRISTPAARRRAGSTPVPSRKQGSSATKLPDFSLIHKRNFEKMESIYDFHHRRQGSSQKKAAPPVADSNQKKAAPPVADSKLPRGTKVMLFKATASSTPLPSTSRIPVTHKQRNTPVKQQSNTSLKQQSNTSLKQQSNTPMKQQRNTPLKPSYSDAKEAIMRKTPVKKTPGQSASVENRNILKGVRLNRRFELQMKHRNMQ